MVKREFIKVLVKYTRGGSMFENVVLVVLSALVVMLKL